MLSGSRLKVAFPAWGGFVFCFAPDRDDIRNLARGWQRIHAFTSVLAVNFIVTSMSHSLSKSPLGRIRKFTYLITYFVFELKMTINGLLSTSSTLPPWKFRIVLPNIFTLTSSTPISSDGSPSLCTKLVDGNGLLRLRRNDGLKRYSTVNINNTPRMPNICIFLARVTRLEPEPIMGVALIIEPVQCDRLR